MDNTNTNNTTSGNKANKIKIVIAIGLPLLVILVVFVVAFLPRLFFTPKYDFIYAISDNNSSAYSYYYFNEGKMYNVVDGKIERITPVIRPEYVNNGKEDSIKRLPVNLTNIPEPKQNLYIYRSKTDSFEPITYDQARKLTLTGNSSAPDGTVLVRPDYYSRGIVGEIIGGSRDRRSFYLKNGTWVKDVTLSNADDNYYYYGNNDFYFLGWVVSQ